MIVFYNKVSDRLVGCAVLVFDKNDDVQNLLATLHLDTLGVHQMDWQKSDQLDAVMGKPDSDNELKTGLYQPLLQTTIQAAQLPNVGDGIPIPVEEDARKGFKGACARRS